MAGIIDTIKLAGTLVLALPAALAGLELAVVRGKPLYGGLLLALAIGLVVIQHRLTTPSDLPELAVKRLGSAVTANEETEADGDEN
ncbi:DUF7533 family protein [Halopiger djelfimassiliensis]|uniref:DUF7533 family protein n=1 Tax=Halopiger djelfimassiliensis TaxID=1293047 RepID=UPI000677D2B8|nr:hypothetical protein [Halopiger djelfimassiliensis]